MSALICGGFCYDTIMVLNEKLKAHWLTAPQHAVRFMVPDLRRQFGGSGGNIAYYLKMLRAQPIPVATVGMDFDPYADWLLSQGICCDYLLRMNHCYTAQTFITIDMDDNRMTAFHPGAMSFAHYNTLPVLPEVRVSVLAADGIEGMRLHALQLLEAGIPFVFAPGDSMAQFDDTELFSFIEQAAWIVVTREHWHFMRQHINLTPEQVAKRVYALIIIEDNQSALIYTQEICYHIPQAPAAMYNDTTGCGDAFCAGLLYGLIKDIDWETTGRIATLMASINVEYHGSQTYCVDLENFKQLFQQHFGYSLIV